MTTEEIRNGNLEWYQRKIGKRSLIALKNVMDGEVVWLQIFYRLGCEAEKVEYIYD